MEVARLLDQRGHRVTVYSYRIDPSLLETERICHVKLREPLGLQLIRDLWFVLAATRAVRRRRHDFVYTVGPVAFPKDPTGFYACFSQRGWKEVWRLDGLQPDLYRRFHGWVSRHLEKTAVRRASAIAAMSRRTADELRPLTSRSIPFAIVPGGVDLEEFPIIDDAERLAARRRFGIKDGTFAIGIVGEVKTGRKGLERLAAAIALKPGDEIVLVAGKGLSLRTTKLLKEIGVSDRFKFLGTGPVRPLLAAVDVVAIPSLYEPFSLVALEAASSRCPVVISDRSGAGSYLADANGAIIVDPNDSNSLRAAFDWVRSHPGEAGDMASRGRKVAENMTWALVCQQAVEQVESFSPGQPSTQTPGLMSP